MRLKLLNYNIIVQHKNLPAMTQKCMLCKVPIYGRIDKRFCSDNCRNRYHNGLKRSESMYFRRINYKLRKNRKILHDSFQSGNMIISYSQLSNKGFDYNYITNYQISDKGHTSYFCYDLGYIQYSDLEFRLLKREISSNEI